MKRKFLKQIHNAKSLYSEMNAKKSLYSEMNAKKSLYSEMKRESPLMKYELLIIIVSERDNVYNP